MSEFDSQTPPRKAYETEYPPQRIDLIISRMSAVENLGDIFPEWEDEMRENPDEAERFAYSFLLQVGLEEEEILKLLDLTLSTTSELQSHFDHYTGLLYVSQRDQEEYNLALKRLDEGLVTDTRITK
jgi:hypothetical protein